MDWASRNNQCCVGKHGMGILVHVCVCVFWPPKNNISAFNGGKHVEIFIFCET